MAHPVYVLLPDTAEWSGVPGTTAQSTAPVRWYLRQLLPAAATQTAVLVPGTADERDALIAQVAHVAEALGGIAVDGLTQEAIDSAAVAGGQSLPR